MNVTLPLSWILGLIITGIAGSYIFTWKTLKMWREGNASLWKAITEIKDNEIKHIEGRLSKLEKDD